eukprot:jgi/Hompol1/5542/HPOL_004522-RA
MISASSPSLTRFQPAIKPASNLVAKQVIEDGLVVKEPSLTQSEWNTEHYIDEWAEGVRKWLATKLLDPLVRRIDKVDSDLTAQGLVNFVCANASSTDAVQIRAPGSVQPMPSFQSAPQQTTAPVGLFGGLSKPSLFTPAQSIAAPVAPQTPPQTLQQLLDRYPNEPIVRERASLEQFLTIGKYNCRAYILARIRSLTPVIMIREQTKWPAHYQLIVDNIIWDVYPSRNNLFHAISLFIYAVKNTSSGYIGMLNLGGKSTDLVDIVAHGPIVSRFMTPRQTKTGNTASAASPGASTPGILTTPSKQFITPMAKAF